MIFWTLLFCSGAMSTVYVDPSVTGTPGDLYAYVQGSADGLIYRRNDDPLYYPLGYWAPP